VPGMPPEPTDRHGPKARPPRIRSLRTRLLVWLLGAIALTVAVQAGMAYRTALAEADEVFDYHMRQTALSLSSGVPYDPQRAAPQLAGQENLDLIVQIWSLDGLSIFESARRAGLPQLAVLGYANVPARGSTYRVFSVQTPFQVIQVAQDLAVRQRMAGRLALRTVAPVALLMPLLMALAWWVVTSSTRPLWRVRRQLAARSADDLAALPDEGLPDEIRPLVGEVNLLFGRLRQAFAAQQHFVADAAHELRTPLAALKLQVEALARAPDDDSRARAVQRLHAGVDRAGRLVDQLLVLARQQAGVAAATPASPVALHALLPLALADVAAAAQARRIDIGLSHADPASVPGYAESLRLLLDNLLGNAVKFTPEGGRIDLWLRRAPDGAVTLGVEDSGPGIPEAERERVMDRFYRGAGAEAGGSGLGLAIVKAIAELHGATLRLGRSERLGGLAATLVFPSAVTAAPAASTGMPAPSP